MPAIPDGQLSVAGKQIESSGKQKECSRILNQLFSPKATFRWPHGRCTVHNFSKPDESAGNEILTRHNFPPANRTALLLHSQRLPARHHTLTSHHHDSQSTNSNTSLPDRHTAPRTPF